MRKTLFTKLMLLVAVFVMGAGTAWAADEKITFSENGYSNSETVETVTGTNFTITFDKGTNSNAPKYYTSGNAIRAYGGNTFTVSSTTKTITKIEITFGSSDGSNTITTDLDTYSNGTWTGSASSVKFTIGGTSGNRRLSAVAVTFASGSTIPTCAVPTFSPEAGTYTVAQEVTISTTTEGATIYYTTDGADPTTESSEYTAAIPVSETMTIKAIAVAEGNDNSAIATATYTIVSFEHEHAGTESDPYTVADARNAIDVNAGITDVYATGIVSKIVTTYNSTYENITFDISADGTEEAAQLRVYRCTGTDAADVQVGDVVVVKGNLTLYDGSTYEFSQGCELVSLTHPVVPTLSVDPGTADPFTYEEGGDVADEQIFEVTGTNLTSDVITVSVTENFDLEGGSGFGNSTLTIASGDVFGVRPKDNLTEGNYEGTLTIASEGANAITIALSCTVTGYVAPSITADETTVNVSAAETDGTINMTYNKIDSDLVDVEFYEADGTTTATYEWIDAEINSDNNLYYTIEANNGEARTAYLKVYGVDNNGGDDYIYSELITITQAAYVAPVTYSLATSITSGKHYIITNGTDAAMGYDKGNNRYAASVTISEETASVASDAGVYEFVICGPDADGNYTIYDENETSGGYLYAASSSSNYLKTKSELDNNGKWSIVIGATDGVATIKAKGNYTRNVMRYNSGSSIFSCYAENNTQADVYLYEKDDEATPTETVTVTAAKYATYCSENALDFSNTGLTAYIAKLNGTNVTFETVTKVPAYTGVLLKADAAGDFAVRASSSVDDVTGNALIGVTKQTTLTTDPSNGIFVLRNEAQGVGFYKTTGSSFTLSAHTAYLPELAGNGARTFIALDDVTSVKGITAETMQNGEVYNLQGQRVMKAQKGLYIMNGKKVLVK